MIRIEDTTNGVLEPMPLVMYPTSADAGTWARLDTLEYTPMTSPCFPGSAEREINDEMLAWVSPWNNARTGMKRYSVNFEVAAT